MSVLVVDDERKMADLLKRGLGESGYEVDLAASGETALAMTATCAYEAVVLDRKLPGIDGIEVCRRLRQGGYGSPVILLSAYASAEDRRAGGEAGADSYFVKPFSLRDLASRLDDLTERRPGSHRPLRPPSYGGRSVSTPS